MGGREIGRRRIRVAVQGHARSTAARTPVVPDSANTTIRDRLAKGVAIGFTQRSH
jgi:hypothetical protein